MWRRADTLEVYHLFRPSAKPAVATPTAAPRHGPFGIFRGPGPSVTEILLALNVLVAALLVLLWKEDFSTQL